jgi:hypothetical protein
MILKKTIPQKKALFERNKTKLVMNLVNMLWLTLHLHTFPHCIWFPLKSSTKWKGIRSFIRRYAYIAFWSHPEALSEIS